MESMTTVKRVKVAGSALTIYMTRELHLLGITKDDRVEITIRKAD